MTLDEMIALHESIRIRESAYIDPRDTSKQDAVLKAMSHCFGEFLAVAKYAQVFTDGARLNFHEETCVCTGCMLCRSVQALVVKLEEVH
jgi:hypothetical protein